MIEDDPGMLPRRPFSKVAYVVVSIGVVMGLCTLAIWVCGGLVEGMVCGMTNLDTPERCR
jgi:hypothetical protein